MILSTWHVDDVDAVVRHNSERRSDADFNTGISVAMPVSQIIDFLRSPEMTSEG